MKYLLAIFLSLGLMACQTATATDAPTTVTRANIEAAGTIAELEALGATRLVGQEVIDELGDKEMDGGAWFWTIKSDGTTAANAKDGSWTSSGKWFIQNGEWCTIRDGKTVTKCRDFFKIGNVYRYTDENGALDKYITTTSN